MDRSLIPNSQRDYFNSNATREEFETLFRRFCFDHLHNLYYDASKYKRAHRDIETYEAKKKEFTQKDSTSSFIDEKDRMKAQSELAEAEKRAKTGKKTIENIDAKTEPKTPASTVIQTIQKKFDKPKETEDEAQTAQSRSNDRPAGQGSGQFLPSTFSKLSQKEQRLMAKVLSVISRSCPDKAMREAIIDAIKKELD